MLLASLDVIVFACSLRRQASRHDQDVGKSASRLEFDMEMLTDLTCPACGYVERLAMPTDACVFFHECVACDTRLRPKAGDCCVFCSFGSVPCPPMQAGRTDCRSPARQIAPAGGTEEIT